MLLLLIYRCLLSCKSIFNNCFHWPLLFLIFSKPAIFHFVANRRHPSPTKEMLEPLLRTASSVGLNLDVSSSKALAESLDNAKVIVMYYFTFWMLHYMIVDSYADPLLLHDTQSDDPYFNKLIRILATRCMTQVRLGNEVPVLVYWFQRIHITFPVATHRQFISAVEIWPFLSTTITGLQLLFTLISLLPFADMQVCFPSLDALKHENNLFDGLNVIVNLKPFKACTWPFSSPVLSS